tara:strand:- start:39 stop:227 length:189 start_codon:yes stop_codon:yes gene_type:complete
MDLFIFIKDKIYILKTIVYLIYNYLNNKEWGGEYYLTSVAKWIRRPASNRKIVGSTPTRGNE